MKHALYTVYSYHPISNTITFQFVDARSRDEALIKSFIIPREMRHEFDETTYDEIVEEMLMWRGLHVGAYTDEEHTYSEIWNHFNTEWQPHRLLSVKWY